MATQLPLLDPRDVASPSSPRRPGRDRGPARRGRLVSPSGPSARVLPRTTAPTGPGDSPYWHLDDHTRELGLRGVEEARRALAAAVQRTGPASAA